MTKGEAVAKEKEHFCLLKLGSSHGQSGPRRDTVSTQGALITQLDSSRPGLVTLLANSLHSTMIVLCTNVDFIAF